jgi:putative membrane-bound dehydrogenase-like protein
MTPTFLCIKRLTALHLSITCLFLLLFAQASPAQVVFNKGDDQLDITIDGKSFATYVWKDEKTSRPYFKQVKALGGEIQITRNHPPQPGDLSDHETYHPGIWWGFGDVGGNDYWRMKAKVIGGEFIEDPKGGDDSGSFAVRNKLLPNDGGETFCEQVCRYTIRKRPSGILLVCESTFERKESDFWLGDQEEMGLGIRMATPIATESEKGGEIRDSEGRTVHKEIRTNQSDYCDYNGPIGGKHGGILLMNDPKNFRKPWWHAVDTGLLIANPLGESELSGRGKKRENVLVKKGETFRLRYGALIHLDDNKDDFDPKKAYEDFLKVLPEIDNDRSSASVPRSDLPEVPAGFEISIFAQEQMVYKPTSICFDSKARLMVGQGPQYPKNYEDSPPDSVVLLIDSDNDGVADESKVFATGFNSIQGLAWKGNDLYVANAPELTVVRDLDGDDEADEYVMIYTDLGNREHALHGLNFAPDGKLYMSKGNSKGHNQPEKFGYVAPKPFRELWDVVDPPGAPDTYPPKKFTKDTYQKSYHHWDDDWGREGGVLRCDPLGENLEIVSRGLRNPWDMTMDDGFNFLGTDNDQDQGDRIMMPFFGAHFGWGHTYSSHWTGGNHLPTAPISGPVFHGSGAGIIYYTHQQFPAEYRNVFFINDWLHGTFVYRPVWEGALMQPSGGRWEHFAKRAEGKMLYRPTDMEFGPDGSIYICGWGGDYNYGREKEGSWMFRITHTAQPEAAKSVWYPNKRTKPYAEWSVTQLIDDLGPEVLPVWRVNAHDELVRRGGGISDAVVRAIDSGRLSQGQQTWAVWALARSAPNDAKVNTYLNQLADPAERRPLNLRIQAMRIFAHQIRNQQQQEGSLPATVVSSLTDPEPRIRFEAVEAIWQARQKQHLDALISQLANEEDRLVFYAGWGAIRELANISNRRKLLADQRPGVRLAALLSLLERHEITVDEVLEVAENDSDPRIQNYALTWAINPKPPEKMPNSTARVELEDSVSVRDLIARAKEAKKLKLRRLYLTMVSRATYRGGDDWERIRDFYNELESDDERALVLAPLARSGDAQPILWSALSGNEALRQSAIKGLATLARQARNSPEEIAEFLLNQLAGNPGHRGVPGAVEALSRLGLSSGWKPPANWDLALAQAFQSIEDVPHRAQILALLLAIDPAQLPKGRKTKAILESASASPAPRLYTSLVTLNARLGIEVEMTPPEKATVDGVLSRLAEANVDRGRELFFSTDSASGCIACHRVSGRGNNFAPDLSGIGLRADPRTMIQSIIEPSATITEGFQLQVFETEVGSSLGVVLHETDAEIRIVKPDGTAETITSASVTNRRKLDQSVMPAIYAFLGDKQIADIGAFLATLRHSSGAP